MELRHLRYFVVVAEELSFTAAAQRLHISQPPLSQQIRDLETEVGTELLRRTSRRVELTPAGAAFLRHARAVLEQVGQAADQARAIGRGLSGKLDIGMTGSVLLGPLAQLVADYAAAYPQVAVRLHEMPPMDQIAALHDRRTDVSFLRCPAVDRDLKTEFAWSERTVAALPEGHPLSGRGMLALADLRGETFVSLRLRDSPFAEYLVECCVRAGFMPRISQEVFEAYSLTSLVAAGLGVALVPETVRTLARSGIVYLPLADPCPIADVMIAYREDGDAVVTRFLRSARIFLEGRSGATQASVG